MWTKYSIMSVVIAGAFWLTACHNDLDQMPQNEDDLTELEVFSSPDEAKKALAKLYASLALTGQDGPAGRPDISGIDEGTSQFTRMLYNLQELVTDHCVVRWDDPGLPDLHGQTWSAGNDFTEATYYRLAQEVSFCNSFITNAAVLAGDAEVAAFIVEARFLRAYAYYNLMDLYGSVPLVTEVSTNLPTQASREEIFNFVESELLDITDQLKAARTNEYGRVDQAAAEAMLARLYLNAEVYVNTDKYAEALTHAENAINSGYSISTVSNATYTAYQHLFLADNNTNGAQNEFLFVLTFDGLSSQTFGGTTFMVHATTGGEIDAPSLGINGGWNGYRTTSALVDKFTAASYDASGYPIGWQDDRALFFTNGQSYEIADPLGSFQEGYAIIKYRNKNADGTPGKDVGGNYVDCDLPLIRLAEMYLIYAEVAARGKGGSKATATQYINELRTRANATQITESDLSPQFVLDERSRELYWEGVRRTDLVRFKQFTTADYLWPWKGNVSAGKATETFRNLYPIPPSALNTNTNLSQNEGY